MAEVMTIVGNNPDKPLGDYFKREVVKAIDGHEADYLDDLMDKEDSKCGNK